MPFGVEEPREVAVLRQVHHERVAIDVVAGVLVIQPRHRAAFERRALVRVVPIDDEPMAVGIERRDQDDDDVAAGRRAWPESVGRGERVEQLVGRLGRADLRRVDARRRWRAPPSASPASRRASSGESVRGSASRWLVVADAIEVPDVLRRADDRGDRAMALGRRPDVDDLHAIGLRGDELESTARSRRRWRACRSAPMRKPKMRFGRRDLRRRAARRSSSAQTRASSERGHGARN